MQTQLMCDIGLILQMRRHKQQSDPYEKEPKWETERTKTKQKKKCYDFVFEK